ncbi:transthyretin [Protopterus annectens]|uniref:transthyretin n=1 Tax=Protopterus annectens TaxID=7888 RepID=UPI001CF9CE5A|nr:transthyretin [Protopterus annectens]
MAKALYLLFLAGVVLLSDGAPVDHGTAEKSCPLEVKILDAIRGIPAAGMEVHVYKKAADDSWSEVATGKTTRDGEIHNLLNDENFLEGEYKVTFGTKSFWEGLNLNPFHLDHDVTFKAHTGGHQHYTIAVLLSPYSITTTAVVSSVQT